MLKNFIFSFKEFIKIKNLSEDKKQYIFYAETNNDWPFLDPVIYELSKKKNIIRVTSDKNDKYINDDNTYYIGKGSIRTIFFRTLKTKAFIMTLTDLGSYYLKKSIYPTQYFYIFHSIVSTHRAYNEKAFDNYDNIFCVGEHHKLEIKTREKIFKLKPKKLFNHGYGKLDKLIHDLKYQSQEKNNLEKKTVLIAPTWGESSIVKSSIKRLIQNLSNTEFNLIFRFHPMTYVNDLSTIEFLKKEFRENKKISFDEDKNSNKSYLESDIMISDWSGAAFEFAFATERPVIFVDTKPKTNNKNWRKLNLPCAEDQIREEIGIIIAESNYDNLSSILNEMIHHKEKWSEKISKSRNRLVFNLGKSGFIASEKILQLTQDEL